MPKKNSIKDEHQIIVDLSNRLSRQIRRLMKDTIKEEVAAALSKALAESAFYKQVNNEMNSSIRNLSEMIRDYTDQVVKDTGIEEITTKQLPEASDQLNLVIQTTEKATLNIIEHVEKMIDSSSNLTNLLTSIEPQPGCENALKEATTISQHHSDMFIDIMSELSFQDLTGQRLQKIIKLIVMIEERIHDMLLKFHGLVEQHREQAIGRLAGREEVKTRVKKIVESCEPDLNEQEPPPQPMQQNAVDSLLSELGF